MPALIDLGLTRLGDPYLVFARIHPALGVGAFALLVLPTGVSLAFQTLNDLLRHLKHEIEDAQSTLQKATKALNAHFPSDHEQREWCMLMELRPEQFPSTLLAKFQDKELIVAGLELEWLQIKRRSLPVRLFKAYTFMRRLKLEEEMTTLLKQTALTSSNRIRLSLHGASSQTDGLGSGISEARVLESTPVSEASSSRPKHRMQSLDEKLWGLDIAIEPTTYEEIEDTAGNENAKPGMAEMSDLALRLRQLWTNTQTLSPTHKLSSSIVTACFSPPPTIL